MKNVLKIISVLFLFVNTTFAQTSSEIQMTIENNSKALQQAIKDGDLQTFSNFYAKDAMLKLAGHEAITGREAIMNSQASLTDQGLELRLQSQEMYPADGYVTEMGTYEIVTSDGQTADRGNYISLWKNIDGKWLIYRDVVSSSYGE